MQILDNVAHLLNDRQPDRTQQWAGAEYRPQDPAVYSYVLCNIAGAGCQAWQGGEYLFRYSLGSCAAFDPAPCYRFKREVLFGNLDWPTLTPAQVEFVGAKINRDGSSDLHLKETIGSEGIGRLVWPGAAQAHLVDLRGRPLAGPLPICEGGKILFPYAPFQLRVLRVSQNSGTG